MLTGTLAIGNVLEENTLLINKVNSVTVIDYNSLEFTSSIFTVMTPSACEEIANAVYDAVIAERGTSKVAKRPYDAALAACEEGVLPEI